ncbi:hypothetical protein HYALB_00008968 [Hymenoscyphus albidus]|uniref:DUF3844 domain-containing protein n=1 Tax=Hymenoscyphus albidus TaxID=595503 RepID=A0A9N9LKM6_9HELO|nr:hypothetical protein HYALB_00008968 [Hymenoscyphus albidus]
MKLSTSLLVPALIGAASASSEAIAYIYQGKQLSHPSKPATLTPEQARLILAQRLGTSRYHDLASSASESTLSYINTFGGAQESLFDDEALKQVPELVLIVEGVSSQSAKSLLSAQESIKPAFSILSPPPMKANSQFVSDLNAQAGQTADCPLEDAINPNEAKCWNGKSKVIHIDLGSDRDSELVRLMTAQQRFIRWAKKEEMNTVLVLMPESARLSKSSPNPYGVYEQASKVPLGRRHSEEIISGSAPPHTVAKQASKPANSSAPLLKGVQPVCHSTLESCQTLTNQCSGHGSCFKKYGGKSPCFTCACATMNETYWFSGNPGNKKAPANKKAYRLVNYGGPACQKKDISGPFWLIAGFTIVIIGLVSWAIGMMFSIGEEKLPGVIGAGVSSKTR